MNAQGRFGVLKTEMFRKDIDILHLAKLMKMNDSTLRRRFNCKQDWKLDEMYEVCNILGWDFEQLHELFPPSEYAEKRFKKKQIRAV